ncbi:MAG: DeoR/GlpR transcriptional regulator, partial [Bacteroidales bacterium]|nr:DeoR/GlpR transcriptional regulator [Bacteroidales bacterium]
IKTTVKQIHSGNVVLLNYSELNCIIADELLLSDKNITIVTNSLRIFDRTKDSTHINNILLAGLYNKETKAFSGTTTYSILSTLRADCFVMHPSGIDFQLGFLADPTEDLPLLQNMLNVARKVILYIDESCIEKKSGLLVSNFNLVNTIVINKKIYEKYKDELSLFDFKIVITEE